MAWYFLSASTPQYLPFRNHRDWRFLSRQPSSEYSLIPEHWFRTTPSIVPAVLHFFCWWSDHNYESERRRRIWRRIYHSKNRSDSSSKEVRGARRISNQTCLSEKRKVSKPSTWHWEMLRSWFPDFWMITSLMVKVFSILYAAPDGRADWDIQSCR